MSMRWGPSWWGKRYTGSKDWEVAIDADNVTVQRGEESWQVGIEKLPMPLVRTGLLLSSIDLRTDDWWLVLQGIPTHAALSFEHTVGAMRSAAALRRSFDRAALAVQAWACQFQSGAREHLANKGWLTREFTGRWELRKPADGFDALLKDPVLAEHIAAQDEQVLEAIALWSTELSQYVADWNQNHLRREMEACRDFFDRVERSPLTPEQAHAVVCFDNRVQVIASAGSGKTSTMVAKAAYALHRNLVTPENILLLAFNKDAANELQQRIRDRLTPLGLPGDKVVARTFHAFGLEIIGRATGRKPTPAPWLEKDTEHLAGLIEELRSTDPSFRRRWDLFRLVYGDDETGIDDPEEINPEDWQTNSTPKTFPTLQGETVKSPAEQKIADWLFYNGVRYEYERSYEHDTADATHRQYFPDFYYPDIDVYHEHFAFYRNGYPPKKFTGYMDGVRWKRATHHRHETTLIETTMAGVWDGSAFEHLEHELTQRGITLDPDPHREIPGRKPLDQKRLVQAFRTFMSHAKSNQLSDADLRTRLRNHPPAWQFRHGLFLDLFATLREKWDHELTTHNYIDFEDMLNTAADHLEAGQCESPYELVMVDEMQDASHARARLARALVAAPGRYLFAVGDDWQSINRFAGADLSVMTNFTGWFGPGETLRLERTFRSPQSLCDISSAFIQKNPQQLNKRVVSTTPEPTTPLSAVAVRKDQDFAHAVSKHLKDLDHRVDTGTIPGPTKGKLQVRILSRYNRYLQNIPTSDHTAWKHLEVHTNTIHKSKGLEADYIIVLGLTKGFYAFPSTITDDPVLSLATPDADTFPHAEERRLFYVALTRAKRSVLLVTVRGKESPFLLELLKNHRLPLHTMEGKALPTVICPRCGQGIMSPRTGRYGKFYGCSTYPICDYTTKSIATQRT